jgi:hypothetical protein
MTIAVVYCFPNVNLPKYVPLAKRFVESYLDYPPGLTDHDLHVVVNYGPAAKSHRKIFEPLQVTWHSHNNYGKDIGAYVATALETECDLMVCFGAPIHFRRAGWLDRITEVYLQEGPGLYGPWGFMQPAPHIRTTVFWLAPELLTTYPHPLDTDHRYGFEYGPKTSILRWTFDNGFPVIQVSWSKYAHYQKDGGFYHVPAEDCLVFDQHTDKLFWK